jgi:hypothetical protein
LLGHLLATQRCRIAQSNLLHQPLPSHACV